MTEQELRNIPEDRFAAGIPKHFWCGSFQAETLVGFICARRGGHARLRHTADIGPLYVTPTARGQGRAGALMQSALEHLATEGCLQVELTLDEKNTAALGLYQSLGFKPIGRRPRSVIIDGQARHDLLMIRMLDGTDLGDFA